MSIGLHIALQVKMNEDEFSCSNSVHRSNHCFPPDLSVDGHQPD